MRTDGLAFRRFVIRRVKVDVAVYLDRIRVGTALPQALLLVKALANHLL